MRDEILGQPSGNRRTTWVDGFAYLDKDTNDNLVGQYEAQANGRSPLLVNGAQGAEYLMSDALGSTTLSTDPSGTALSQTRYDAWGNAETQGSSQNKFGYTGHQLDPLTGLVYFKARYYDPMLGRFIGADPFEGEPSVPVSWNSYLYSNGNPVNVLT